jgi:Pathogenicity locus
VKEMMPRIDINNLQDIPNIGKATEKNLNILGINKPNQLIGRDPYKMYNELCNVANQKYDPCLIDIFISAVKFMEGGSPKKWWEFTEERKIKMGDN